MADRRRVDLTRLPILQLRDWLADGAVTAAEVAEAHLAVIAAKEPDVQAWQFHDPALVRRQAAALDGHRKAGRPVGPLHGVPVGIKDIIDTADMPTGNGTPIDDGRRPKRDAHVVARLRAAGALVMGKTVTTEMAYFSPGKTCNPHDLQRTPGGSSSGSAAAVAAGMVPLALGTQTMASVIRPASFCGVHGFKPSHGLIGRTGVLLLSRTLDTIGVFARELEGAALAADVLEGPDPDDLDLVPRAPSRFLDHATGEPPVAPMFAFYRTPMWDQADLTVHAAFDELMEVLAGRCDTIDPGPLFAEGYAAQRVVMATEMARNLGRHLDRSPEALSEPMREILSRGRSTSAVDYLAACDWRAMLNAGLERVFDRYDAIITPAAAGEAPVGLGSTGNPVFGALWSLLGVPAITLPLMSGPNGMPIGVQLVGRQGEDGRLLRNARHLAGLVAAAADAEPEGKDR